MYCGNCKYFSKRGDCLHPLNHKREVAYFAPMCEEGSEAPKKELPANLDDSSKVQRVMTCRSCGATLPVELFAHRGDKYIRVCMDCKREMSRRAGQAGKGKTHNRTR